MGCDGYELRPSHLYWKKVDWELSGTVGLGKPGMPLSAHVGNAEFGTVDFAMPAPGVMEAHVRNLAPEKLPYAKLDTLKANQPRITADFRWDKGRKTGAADVSLEGRFKGEKLQARAQAEWDAQALVVRETKASLSGNEITASATINLHGRQFYELSKLAKEDFESVSLGADRFDLAKALAVAMPEPPLKSGTATGKLGFSAAGGFSGTYKLENIHLSSDDSEEEKIAIKELSIMGRGDALVIKAVTVSEEEPLFRDSVNLEVAGVLGRTQTLVLKARAGQDIFVDFRGAVKDFNRLEGRLGVRGDVVLPGSSGELKNLRVGAEITMPFKDGAKGLSVVADTLGGVYVVAGLDTQTFSAPVRMIGGKIAIPNLTMNAKSGARLSGRFEYDPATKRMSGSLAGNSFAAQFGKGDKVKLRDVKVELQGDSTSLDLQGFHRLRIGRAYQGAFARGRGFFARGGGLPYAHGQGEARRARRFAHPLSCAWTPPWTVPRSATACAAWRPCRTCSNVRRKPSARPSAARPCRCRSTWKRRGAATASKPTSCA